MKKSIVALVFIVWCCAECIAQTINDIRIYYFDIQGEKVFLDKESYYNIEEKPTRYYIDIQEGEFIYIVEIYRVIDSRENFYKSFSLGQSDIGSGFDLSGVFSDVTSPFIVSSAIIIRICMTDKQHYLKLKSREQCNLTTEYKILR